MDSRTYSEQEHAQRAKDEAKSAVREAGEHLKSAAGEAAEHGRRTARRLSEPWENTRNNLQEKAVTRARATDEVIRDHPYQTIGLAFGVGMLVGILINRK